MRIVTTSILALGLALGLVGGAQAQDFRPGCYERIYTDAHLAKQPAQVVKLIRLKIGNWMTEVAREGSMMVIPADQGHVRGQVIVGQPLMQFLICGNEAGDPVCQVECDGGSLELRKISDISLTCRTRYMLVGLGEECGGALDLAEVPGTWVSYRLDRVDDAKCQGI